MPAKNPRVMVVMEQPLYYTVCRKAKRDGVSLSTEMRDLVRQALEDNEDIIWSQVADKRTARRSSPPSVSHKAFWKRLGI
ncbi:MAG: hypothetical protein IPP35_00645 [Elusimicrobia bacterium]|jgi:hypothetical protein|nr:hypothetical protein [Elusimicrobiota bacterium]